MIQVGGTPTEDEVDHLVEEEKAKVKKGAMVNKGFLMEVIIPILAHIVEDQIMRIKIVGLRRSMAKTEMLLNVIIANSMAILRKTVLKRLQKILIRMKTRILLKKVYFFLAYLLMMISLRMFGIFIVVLVTT